MPKKILIWGGGAKAMLAIEIFKLKNIVIFDPYIKKLKIKNKIRFYNKFSDLKNVIKICSKFHVCIGNDNTKKYKTRTLVK